VEEFLIIGLKVSRYILIRYFLIAGGMFLLFYLIIPRFKKLTKIQEKLPKTRAILSEIGHSMFTVVIFSFMATLILFIIPEHTLIYEKIGDYGWVYYLISFPLMFLMHDTYFYWLHRIMHLPVIFRYVHRVHHKSTNPTPFASYSFHFLEGILEAAILPIIALSIPAQREALLLFLLMQFLYNVYGHLGYEIYPRWILRTCIGRWLNTSTIHNSHHKNFEGNYGLYFLFWDRWMGTFDNRYHQDLNERVLP
jgi:sterol desaturase/sphingolipid hydroxylase (fatty acid hydroxylase superfamily)